ncbi:MAG: hypothetical protein WCF85_12290 [Rhodospirillaceae bacterium]
MTSPNNKVVHHIWNDRAKELFDIFYDIFKPIWERALKLEGDEPENITNYYDISFVIKVFDTEYSFLMFNYGVASLMSSMLAIRFRYYSIDIDGNENGDMILFMERVIVTSETTSGNGGHDQKVFYVFHDYMEQSDTSENQMLPVVMTMKSISDTTIREIEAAPKYLQY